MLQALTLYFLQFRRLAIPQIGSLELVQQSASLDVADQLMHPPVFACQFSNDDRVHSRQARYFGDPEGLAGFGNQLRSQAARQPFHWSGIGLLQEEGGVIRFQPDSFVLPGWQPVPARKVLRGDARHTVLQGEREVLSEPAGQETAAVRRRRPDRMLIGWILLFLAVLAILFLLYQGRFKPASSGSKWRLEPAAAPATNKTLP